MVSPCKEMQDSLEFLIPRCGFQIPRYWILDSNHFSWYLKMLNSRFQSPRFQIPQVRKISWILDFRSKTFPDYRIWIPLHETTMTRFCSIFSNYWMRPRGTQQKLYGKALLWRPTPYPFIYHFSRKRYPFHIPCLQLCIPFNCCKCIVFKIRFNHKTRTFSRLF